MKKMIVVEGVEYSIRKGNRHSVALYDKAGDFVSFLSKKQLRQAVRSNKKTGDYHV
jgi:hypothetical protein